MRNPLLMLLPAVLVGACTQEPAAPDENGQVNQINHVISDGSHSAGNPDFFFLPPLVGSPTSNPNFDAGKFNGRLHPVMVVYALPAGSACTGTPTDGPRAVAAAPQEEMYQLDWDTRAANLDANTTYRLCVMSSPSGGTLLGFIDLMPVTGGVKNARTGEVFTFNDGRTVPVKFRIETGALSYDPAHPDMIGTEFTADAAGGTVTLQDDEGPSRLAAVSVPAGAVPSGQEVTIVLAKEDPKYEDPNAPGSGPSKCLPGDLLQSDGCYQIRTEPALFAFDTPVRVEICVDASPVPEGLWPDLLVHKYNTTQGLQALPWAEPTLIGSDCSGPIGLGSPSAALGLFAQWVGNLVAPSELSASVLAAITVPKGIGGTTGSFSDFGGAVPSSAPQAPVLLRAPDSAGVGQPGLVATMSGGSGTGWFSLTSLTPSVCWVREDSIFPIAMGRCSLTATKAGDATYKPATSDTASFNVALTLEYLSPDFPASPLACLTDQFEWAGVIVSFAPSTTAPFPPADACARLIDAGAYYMGGGPNMAISSMTNGAYSLQFTTLPDTVRFELVANASAPAADLTATNSTGATLTPLLISSSTYTKGTNTFRMDTFAVVAPEGVASVRVREWPYMYILDHVMVTIP